MAIPTQFSVTSTRTAPISNPALPKDPPQTLDAENVSIVDGASILSSLSVTGIDAPTEYDAQSVVVIGAPVEKTAQAKATTEAPTAASVLPAASIDAPTSATAESKATASAPSTLSTTSATPLLPPFPLNHARILWDNKLQSYSSVTQNNTGIPINALTPNTWQRWEFSVSGEDALWSVTFESEVPFDTVCIGAHNLHDIGAQLQVNYDPEPLGGYNPFGSLVTPTDNSPIMVHLSSPVNAIRIQIQVIGGVGNGFIGYISAGEALQMQRPFFNGHTPITDGDVTDYYSNRTESGEIIGQQVRRKGFETSADWQNIDDTWYRTYFAPFKQSAKLRPFFFAWNLLEYPEDVGFCRISQDISAPMQNGTRTKRSISMNLLGTG